jgi:hypothetical protein
VTWQEREQELRREIAACDTAEGRLAWDMMRPQHGRRPKSEASTEPVPKAPRKARAKRPKAKERTWLDDLGRLMDF